LARIREHGATRPQGREVGTLADDDAMVAVGDGVYVIVDEQPAFAFQPSG
jgi:hypothetical protein